MVQEQKERLIELYEKGILTKEEAKSCFLDLEEDQSVSFVEEKSKLSFSLPNFKVFSATTLKQDFFFQDIESMTLRVEAGMLAFYKHKEETVKMSLAYPQQVDVDKLSKVYVERGHLFFETILPCQLTLYLPDKWMSVLDLKIGSADARLDYLPFEDISICSQSDKKQQDIRLTSIGTFSQWICIQLNHANLSLHIPKKQAVKGRVDSSQEVIVINRKKKLSPYFCEKKGEKLLDLRIHTQDSHLMMKGIKDVWNI